MRFSLICLLLFAALVLISGKTVQARTQAVILADPDGTPIYRLNETVPMIPASTLKILTSLAALKHLGKEHRFTTKITYDPKSRHLYLKGFGDPLLVSEELARLSNQILETYSIRRISNLSIDNSYFTPNIEIPGTGQSLNPYDSTAGAFCANFNTFQFKWNPKLGSYASAEPQTPFLEIMHKDIQSSGLKQGRILLSEKLRDLYPGLLIIKFLEQKGVQMTGQVITGPYCMSCPQETLFESSFSLEQLISKLLTYSNNFIANQLMLAMGAKVYGPPATLEKGIRVLQNYADQELKLGHVILAEGSGVSRANKISASQMLELLCAFKPYHPLLKKEGTDLFKTGTLSDVRTRAGYLIGRNNALYPYVILLNDTSTGYEKIHKELKRKVAERSLKLGRLR